MGIYDYIPKDRYITREELVNITGWSDRRIRDEINELRKNPDTIIISSSQRKGYKRPERIEEMEECLRESVSRSKDEHEKQTAILKAIKKMRKQTEGYGVQIFLDFS